MARKQQQEEKVRDTSGLRRWMLITLGFVFVAASSLYALHRVEGFLVRDERFVFRGPRDLDEESVNLQIDGVKHASRDAIHSAFLRDFNRSLYTIPLEERRRNLLAVNWVKDVSISRVWPDRLLVRVTERTPAAFVPRAPGLDGNGPRPALIDQDGVFLYLDNPASLRLPVLAGIGLEMNDEARKLRVKRLLRLNADLGARADKVSEVDAEDADNLRLTMQMGEHAVLLTIGNRRFRQKLDNFAKHYPEIQAKVPDATCFDLRLEDRITVTQCNGGANANAGTVSSRN